MSKFEQPGGKKALAKQLAVAIQTIGFFYIVNFGLTQDEVDRQFAIGKSGDLEHGITDNTEIYNIPKFIPAYEQPHPAIITAHRAEIEHFARHIHDNIVRKLLVLFAIILELPEDALTSHHRYDEKSDCHLRYMKYHRRTAEENEKLENVWVRGHTDFGSLTLLFRQPVAALQFLTNGFLKSSIHRVVAPPPDQALIDRLGVLYLVRPEDALELRPLQSAVLRRLRYDTNTDEAAVGITAGEWVKARVRGNIDKDCKSATTGRELTQEVIKGKLAKYYN